MKKNNKNSKFTRIYKGNNKFEREYNTYNRYTRKFRNAKWEYDKFNVIIIVEAAGKTLGIIVDQVGDVLSIDKDSVQPPIDFGEYR